jgi:hypothetical protein
VNMQLRRSNPWLRTLPTVAIGDGRTYASAARNPGALVSSGGPSVALEEIDGVFSLTFRLPGFTLETSEFSFLVFGPAFKTNDVVELLVGEGGIGESGRGRSSSEKMDKSSPFHWSPK